MSPPWAGIDAALRPQPRRTGADFWATPSCLSGALVRHVLPTLTTGTVWEPACGDGRLSEAMKAAGRSVIATDLYGGDRTDFLTAPPPAQPLAAIITNPPFRLLDRFIRRGLFLVDNGSAAALVLLWRWDHLTARTRGPALRRALAVHLCLWRPRWIEASTTSPRWSFAWIVWRGGHPGRPALITVQPAHENGETDLLL